MDKRSDQPGAREKKDGEGQKREREEEYEEGMQRRLAPSYPVARSTTGSLVSPDPAPRPPHKQIDRAVSMRPTMM